MLRRFVCLLGLAWVSTVSAGDWPNWRGPAFNGVAQGTGFPLKWSPSENILWKVDLPGKGASTPAVWGDRLVLTCGIERKIGDKIEAKNGVLCFDLAGHEIWRQQIGSAKTGKHRKATGCNASASTDGAYWYTYFKSGDLVCLNFSGDIVWQHNLFEKYGEDTLWWDQGTSPVLTRDNVVVATIHSGPSYLVAFDKKSGKEVWKQDRNLDAPREAAQTYATPVVLVDEGREIIVALGADHVTAHDAANGAELWRVGGLNPAGEQYFRSISSPVVSDGIVVAPYARGSTLTAIRLGGKGDVTKTHVVWSKSDLGADVPTPAAVAGRVYLSSDKGLASCLDIKTGKVVWSETIEKNRAAFSASPIVADGRIYCTREDGKTFVLEQGDKYNLLATNELPEGEFVVASPVFVNGRILIRTHERLFCIGK